MAKQLKLQQSEAVVVHAASRIYAAYITAGKVQDGKEDEWIKRSIRDAIRMAQATDDAVISDDEVQSLPY